MRRYGSSGRKILTTDEAEEERIRVARLRDSFVEELLLELPAAVLNGPAYSTRHPGNANVRFPGMNAEDLMSSIQPHLAAATGSACTSGIPEPSHVLRATV